MKNKFPAQIFLTLLWTFLIIGRQDVLAMETTIINSSVANSSDKKNWSVIDVNPDFLKKLKQNATNLPSDFFASRIRNRKNDHKLQHPTLSNVNNNFFSSTDPGISEKIKRNIADGSIEVRARKKTASVSFLSGTLLNKSEDSAGNDIIADIRTNIKPVSREQQDKELANKFLNSYKEILHIINPDQEFKFLKRTEDNLGRCHLYFSQTYQNIPVWPAELTVHLDPDGNVDLMTGAYIPTPKNVVTTPSISFEQAAQYAINTVTDSETANISKKELIVYGPLDQMPRLAWKINVNISLSSIWLVIIDAHNGKTLSAINQVKNAKVTGSGLDLQGNFRSVNLWEINSSYYMIDASKKMFIPEFNPNNPLSIQGGIIVYDGNFQTENPASPEELKTLFTSFFSELSNVVNTSIPSSCCNILDSVNASFALSETFDYFLERHGRNSFDEKGGTIRVVLDAEYNNASWFDFFGNDLSFIFLGGTPVYFATALDVVAHEFTHGVINNSANFISLKQSGAISEAFSDIFGEMVEARTAGGTDWVTGNDSLGREILNDDQPIRNMRNPSSLTDREGHPFPSRMSEYNNLSIANDSGGIHLNSTIISHAYYLLAEGLPEAIGILDAEKIFYRSLTSGMLHKQSQFIDVRRSAIRSAKELFGNNSIKAAKVAEAFNAVEITEDLPKTDLSKPNLPEQLGLNLDFRAVIETVEKGDINASWLLGGIAKTKRGDTVLWGYFYAEPDDVSWGNAENPELFVKIWLDVSGRIDVNFFHVSVPPIRISTSFSGDVSNPDQVNTSDMERRYIRHTRNPDGTNYAKVNFEDGIAPALDLFAPDPLGFQIVNNLKIGTQINTIESGFLEGSWQFGGRSVTSRGDEVVWGYFSADSRVVSWGNIMNPEIFVKIWFDISGRIDVNYFHVSVPEISIFSDYLNNGFSQKGVTVMADRYTRHEFHQ